MSQEVPKWSVNQYAFILWMAMPSEYRDVRKEEDFAKKIGVDRKTLWRWKKLPGFWGEVQKAVQQYLADAVPDGVVALKDQVRRGSFKHQRLYFEMVGMYTPKSESTVKGEIKQHITEYEYTNDDSGDTEPTTDE